MKNVWQNLLKENKNHSSFIPLLLVLFTIPLSFAVNNIALAIFLLVAIFTFKKENFSVNLPVILPILLYIIMIFSLAWSIDKASTASALSKEIPLLLIPLAFLFIQDFSSVQKQKIIAYYSYAVTFLVFYFLTRAIIRYFILNDIRVFFYHGDDFIDYGLVPKLLNAIHVSIFVAVAFFHFLTIQTKTKIDTFLSLILFGFLLLLSSKNIVLAVVLLVLIYTFFFAKSAHKLRLRNLILFGLLLVVLFSVGRIKQRFEVEFQTNTDKSLSANVVEGIPNGVHYVSINEAWTSPKFTPNDYFNGTAFRVYQFRIFIELVKENAIFFTGFGLNASYPKIKEKADFYNLYEGEKGKEGYQNKNFHNQYVQVFAELGFFGFTLLAIILIFNLRNAYKSKDFVHFAFAFLMISLFLTESFLWRQRGVVFFTVLYCLFNSFPKQWDLKNNSKVA